MSLKLNPTETGGAVQGVMEARHRIAPCAALGSDGGMVLHDGGRLHVGKLLFDHHDLFPTLGPSMARCRIF